MLSRTTILALGLVCLLTSPPGSQGLAAELPNHVDSAAAHQAYRDGNYRDAFDTFGSLLLSENADTAELVQAFPVAIACLKHLNQVSEIDEFRAQVARAHAGNGQLLIAIADSYLAGPHHGYLIAGEYQRGHHRGGGKLVNSSARDRTRALELYQQASVLMDKSGDTTTTAHLWGQLASALQFDRGGNAAWRLQSLTRLDQLPEYEEGWGNYDPQVSGAPVDEDGQPVFYDVPSSWEKAASDGERWRWSLQRLASLGEPQRYEATLRRAMFLRQQFGVQTLADYHGRLANPDADLQGQTGTWALHTLSDHETIARLATGIRRLELPSEHNPVKLYQQAIAQAETRGGQVSNLSAVTALTEIFQNRRQFSRAAEYFNMAIEHSAGDSRKQYQAQLDQIVDNWGRFEPLPNQPARRGATVQYRFRNGDHVQLVAHKIDVKLLLADIKAYLKSQPRKLDRQKVQIDNLGYRLVRRRQKKYLGDEIARWSLDLEPRADHFDRRITISTPLAQAGAYLVTATMKEGNTSTIVLWVADTAIVRKPMAENTLYYVADAVTGAPIVNANVEFFGYWNEHLEGTQFRMRTDQFAELTDEAGQALMPDVAKAPANRMQWLATATTKDGRFAYLGFAHAWYSKYYDQQYSATKVFTITDRPVYRPAQTVQFKFWVRHAQYDQEAKSQFAHQAFQVEIANPKGEKVFSEAITSDQYSGIEGVYELPDDAALGEYHLTVVNHGGGNFRVEEYKKPEFEVVVEAPIDPVELGETITAKIRANYYFGAPVTNARVKYKVLRTTDVADWYPPSRWDWLYGPGYWWFAYDYTWYPQWRRWGSPRPAPRWFWRSPTPPEVVVECEAEIGADGTLEVQIDTSLAKALHPHQDHRYQIQAEVVDQSRRTIVGNGHVLVSQHPLKVFAWVDRGYYRVGDTIEANFAARRVDGEPVQGNGVLKLLKIDYDDAEDPQPIETEVRRWDLATNDQGQARLQISASKQGQYRLLYSLTDEAGHASEGGYVFTIVGEGYDGRDFRFDDLELIPDRRDYAPGDKVQLQVNANRAGSTVMLFVRPANGTYLPPRIIHLDGKSTVVELEVTSKDMPNFFVEAVTVANGRVHTRTREIHVPPEKRILNVEVVPSAEGYEPGQKAEVKLKVTDHTGRPYVGSTVITVYDKSVEYISGGSNVGDIKAFFWKWRRQHRPQSQSNLDRSAQNVALPRQLRMRNLGLFGAGVADELSRRKAFSSGFESDAINLHADFGRQTSRAAVVAPAAGAEKLERDSLYEIADNEAGSIAPGPQTFIRHEFADTALWIAALETNSDGLATAKFEMPDNLTTWKIRVWSMGQGTRVGEGTTEVVTRKNLVVRLQAPRFFVELDEVLLSANVHNYLSEAKRVNIQLQLEGETLEAPGVMEETVEIEAGGEHRIDWRVTALDEGEAVVRMVAQTDGAADAVQMRFPVYVHGLLKTDSYSGVLRPDQTQSAFEITVPADRRVEDSRLEIRYRPTLAGTMVDALPYLIDYPHGCTEQTLNRFLPAVITQQTLLRMGLDLEALAQKQADLNSPDLQGDPTGWETPKQFGRNPVFDQEKLDTIVKAGVKRLTEMQLADGGWGWFSGWGEQSTPHTTAIVVRGLQIADQNNVALVPGVRERGIDWLANYQAGQIRRLQNYGDGGKFVENSKPHKRKSDNIDALVYMVLVDAGQPNLVMRDFLVRDRTHLAVYSLAMVGIALHQQGENEKLAMILSNIGQYVVTDDENQTAYLNLPAGSWWFWYGSEFEAHAYYLKLLAATQPQSDLASKIARYLVNNRKHATYWNSTRDTALVIEALADFLTASGESHPELTVEIWMDGQKRKEVAINRDNLFSFDHKFVLTGEAVQPGRHTVELRKHGTGPLYFTAYLRNFTQEDDIRRSGLELKVNRRFYKLVSVDQTNEVAGSRGEIARQRGASYDRQPITNLGLVKSGDLIEVELVIESKNDYEYIVLEDMKAAGFEPVQQRSGYNGNEMGAYLELRDNRVNLFVRQLARGTHSVSYRLRAEIPGRFSALPTRATAMYAPDLTGNSDEMKIRIEDRDEG